MPLLLPLDTSASATPQSPPGAVILDALEPLRCLRYLVTPDATEETASCPVCYTSLGLEVESPVHSKAVLWHGGGIARPFQSSALAVQGLLEFP